MVFKGGTEVYSFCLNSCLFQYVNLFHFLDYNEYMISAQVFPLVKIRSE